MNCSNQSPENDKKDVCRSAYQKRYYAENREQILTRQKRYRTENAEILKTRLKRRYKTTRNGSSRAREPMFKRTRNTPAITKKNRERLNEYWRGYYAKNKERIRLRLREQRQRKIGQSISRFGVWDQGSEKLETSLAPSEQAVTLCKISLH